MSQAGVAYVTIKPDWQGFTRDMKRTAPSFNQEFGRMGGQIGRSFAGLGKQAGTAFAKSATSAAKVGAAGLAVGLVGAVKVAGDFEQQLSALGSVSGASAKDMTALRKEALKAGAATKFSALDAVKAQTELAKGGLATSQILKGGLSSALALAAAGELDLADAASTTVNSMKLFGINGARSIKVADALATAANSTTADVSDFALALNQSGSAAKTVGLSFPETITALETLAEVGIKGSDAGTSLKTALVQLASPSSLKAVEAAKELGINVFDAKGNIKSLVDVSKELQDGLGGLTKEQRIAAATTLVGQDGFRALLALYDAGPKKIAKLQGELNKQGTAAEVARKKQDNLKGSLEQLGGSVETLGVNVGTLMIPFIRRGADELQKFTNEIGTIAADDKLDLGEKLAKSFAVAKVDAAPWIRKLKREIIQADIPGEIGELLTRGSGRIGEGFESGKFTDQLLKQIDDADLPEKVGDLISEATPKLIAAAASAGVLSAGTFVKAFTGADAWGKLALGTFLLSKMGGAGALKKLGGKIADSIGSGGSGRLGGGGLLGRAASKANPVPVFVVNQTGGGGGAGPIGKVGGKLVPVLGGVGGAEIVGLAVSAALPIAAITYLALTNNKDLPTRGEPHASSPSNPQGHVAFDQGAPSRRVASDAPGAALGKDEGAAAAAAGADQLRARTREIARDIKKLRADAGRDFDGISGDAAKAFQHIRDSIGTNTDQGKRLAARNFKGAAAAIADAMQHGRGDVKSAMSTIRSLMINESGKGKDALARNYDLIVPAVRSSMTAAERETGQGLALIRGLMTEQLKNLGFTPQQAINIAKTGDPDANKGREKSAATINRKQRGGPIFGGLPTGDSIPALLERGEYVLNRKAVNKIGKDALDAVNFGAARRFQAGGSVTGDTDFVPALLNALKRLSAAAGRDIFVQSGRRTVAEQLAQGPSTPGHPVAGPNGPHVRGVAADITPGFPVFGALASKFGLGFTVMPQEPWHIQLLDAALAGAVANVKAPELKRVLAGGKPSALKGVVQGALDVTRGAAQQLLKKAAGAASAQNGVEASVPSGGSASGNGADLMRAISKQRGWNFADWWALDAKETSHGANLSNPTSSARLRGQFLDMNYGKYGPGSDPAQNPSMAQQIESMAAYIADRYGNPTSALSFHNANNFYRSGGLVGLKRLITGGPAKGIKAPLPGGVDLGKALGKIKAGRTVKLQDKATKSLVDSISGIGFGPQAALLSGLAGDVDLYGDYADRASRLTDSSKIQEALEAELTRRQGLSPTPSPLFPPEAQQAIVDQLLGRVGGATQLGWLTKQLTALFDWRNVITDTTPIVAQLQKDTAALLKDAEKRLDAVTEQIKKADAQIKKLSAERDRKAKHEETLTGQIKDEMDKPVKKRDQKKLKAWREDLIGTHNEHVALNQQLSGLRTEQRGRTAVQAGLQDKVIPALEDKGASLVDSQSTLLGNLVDVQGLGGSMSRLPVMPPLDQVGGKLFDVGALIKDLTDNPPRIDATVPEQTENQQRRADLLADLLREANQRTAVSEAAFKVFKDLPYGGAFKDGGTVPGAIGAPVLITAHGGEEVVAANGSRVRVVMEDHRTRVFVDDVEQVVERVTRRQARTGARGLPGLGGGNIR